MDLHESQSHVGESEHAEDERGRVLHRPVQAVIRGTAICSH